MAAAEITLGVGASAEPDTCGSCKFFDRKTDNPYYSAYGQCRFTFPAKIATAWNIRDIDPKQRDREYTGNEDQIKDTDRCDLHRHDGKIYIVQRRVGPGA